MLASARARIGQWVHAPGPQNVIVALIVINAITLGLETSETVTAVAGVYLRWLEHAIITVFVLEIALKLFAAGPRFFRNGWNLFDFLIVGIALVPETGSLAILRSLRILRVLRLLSSIRRLRAIIEALLAAIPSIGWIAFLLVMVFYIFGVMGTELFGERFPEWFGTLGASMYTLFQIMTLESWSMGIARPVMTVYPLAWVFFVAFILVTAFTILNLFIGIIVNSMQSAHWEEDDARARQAVAERQAILDTLERISQRLDALERREPPN